jgi:hypothetical protein
MEQVMVKPKSLDQQQNLIMARLAKAIGKGQLDVWQVLTALGRLSARILAHVPDEVFQRWLELVIETRDQHITDREQRREHVH